MTSMDVCIGPEQITGIEQLSPAISGLCPKVVAAIADYLNREEILRPQLNCIGFVHHLYGIPYSNNDGDGFNLWQHWNQMPNGYTQQVGDIVVFRSTPLLLGPVHAALCIGEDLFLSKYARAYGLFVASAQEKRRVWQTYAGETILRPKERYRN